MAILTDEYVEYNTDEHFYYLNEAGMIKYSGYDYLVDLWKPSAKVKLEKMGRALHALYTDSKHNMKPKYFKHKDLIHYKIFNNAYGERQAIINALAYMIELEEAEDWFTLYLAGDRDWPKSIRNILKQANVLVYGEMHGMIEENEYEVDY
jgi:hypothetical protein